MQLTRNELTIKNNALKLYIYFVLIKFYIYKLYDRDVKFFKA